jgi:hypothetical protein
MELNRLAASWDALATATSRRGVLAGLSGGVLAAGLFGRDETLAKKRRKRGKNKRKKKKDRPQTRADARCADSNDSALGPALPDARLAQSFTAIRGGSLVRAELDMERGSTLGEYILHLAPLDAFGFPTNQVLADAVVASALIPDDATTVAFTFPQPATVVAGEQYALVLSRPEVGELTWRGRQDDGCTGRAFASDGRTAPFQSADLAFDLIFATFIRS